MSARLLALALLLALHGLVLFRAETPLAERRLGGADAYSRLVQVRELHEHGWYRDLVAQSNAPEGEPRVWSRAFDLVLWPGAAALAPFMGFAKGLHVWGVLAPPVLHALTLLALIWAAAPLLRREAWLYLGLLFPFQVSVTAQYLAGRPDHHPLLGLLFVLALGATFRVLAGAGWRQGVLAGLVLAAALWVSVESLVLAAAVLVVLAVAWARRRIDAGDVVALLVAVGVGIALALAVERPPATWTSIEYDRLSVVHLALFVWLSLAALALWGVERRLQGDLARGLAVAFAVVAVAAAQYVAWPAFFAGPMADITPAVRALNLGPTAEYGPAIDLDSLRNTAHLLLLYLSGALAAALVLPFLLAREREAWWPVALVGAVYLGLALYQIRWGLYAELLALPVLAAGIGRLAATGLRLAAFLVLAVGLTVLGWTLRPEDGSARAAAAGHCEVPEIARFLMTEPSYATTPMSVVNFAYDGPELIYRTHHRVVATPDHRNGTGLLDAHAFFAAAEPAAARAIAERRRLDLVLLCADPRQGRYYREAGKQAIWDRLAANEPPSWLRPVALPQAAGAWKLYAVVR